MLVPILLAIAPQMSHTAVTAVSMLAVALSASSGSLAYFRKKTLSLKVGLICSLVAFPGTGIGVYLIDVISKNLFSLIFGIFMLIYAPLLFFKKRPPAEASQFSTRELPSSFYFKAGGASFFVGILSSLLAIGGGVIYVPLLNGLGLPIRFAIGTSQFIIALTAWAASLQHIYYGNLDLGDAMNFQLGIGVIIGAQFGPWVSNKIPSRFLLKALATLLMFVAVRLIVSSL